jgi:hypothetical protein
VKSKDPIVESVVDKFRTRSDLGLSKYGTTLHENDAPTIEWIVHIQEELMDAVLYLHKLKTITINKASGK